MEAKAVLPACEAEGEITVALGVVEGVVEGVEGIEEASCRAAKAILRWWSVGEARTEATVLVGKM